MKATFVGVFFILFSSVLFAQSEYTYDQIEILRADTLYRGIYLTYDEFVHNSPGLSELPIAYTRKSYLYDKFYFIDGKRIWEVENGVKEMKLLIDEGNYWGYCDGKSVFYKGKKLFSIDRYCVFENVNLVLSSYAYPSNYHVGSINSGYNVTQGYLDILSGEIYPLTDENIEMLVSDYPNLYQDFISLKKKERALKYVWYINQINEKFQDYY